jgi:hypothetical protein
MLSLLLHPAYKGFTKTLWIKQFAFDPPFPSDAPLFHTSFIVRPKIGEKKGGAASFGRAVSDCQKNLSERFGGPQVRNLNLRGER